MSRLIVKHSLYVRIFGQVREGDKNGIDIPLAVMYTRPRDFYDVFILTRTQHCDKALFRKALQETSSHRGTTEQIADVSGILIQLLESPELLALWEKYRKQFLYAQSVSFTDVMNAASSLLTRTDTN